MTLYQQSGISVESWVEIDSDTPIRYEVDRLNQQETRFFGEDGDLVPHPGRHNLAEVAVARAHADPDAPEPA